MADQLELGFHQLATMLRSGLSLLAALRICARQLQAGCRAARLWSRVADEIERGASFSSALERTGALSRYLLALMRVGEQTGELGSALDAAAEHLAKRREHRALVAHALFYPFLVLLMTIGVVAFMMVKVIPALKEFLVTQKRGLPEMTALLIDISDWIRVQGLVVLLATLGVVVLVWLLRRTAACGEAVDAFWFRLPVVGRVMRLSATAVFARSLSILLSSGVPLLAALEAVKGMFGNLRLQRIVFSAREAVLRGGALSSSLLSMREFSPMLAGVVSVGESSGTLAETLAETATFHEGQLAAAVRRLGAIVEPLMLVVVGVIVGFVYIAFFLAVFSLASA